MFILLFYFVIYFHMELYIFSQAFSWRVYLSVSHSYITFFFFSVVKTVSHLGHHKIQRVYWLVLEWVKVDIRNVGSSGNPLVLASPSGGISSISKYKFPPITWPRHDPTWPPLTSFSLSLYMDCSHLLTEALHVCLFRFQRPWPTSSLYTRSQSELLVSI